MSWLQDRINDFLNWKKAGSITYNDGLPRLPLPQLPNVFAVADYLRQKFVYRPDPVSFDHYTHPEASQWAMENNDWEPNGKKISFDCDDYAVWAHDALIKAGYDPGQIWIVNLVVNPFYFWEYKYNHVICLLFNYQFNGLPWIACIDTSGLNWLCSKNLDGTDRDWARDIMTHFERGYQCKYEYFHKSEYPF